MNLGSNLGPEPEVYFILVEKTRNKRNKETYFMKITRGRRMKHGRVMDEAERREHCFLGGEEELSSLEPHSLV